MAYIIPLLSITPGPAAHQFHVQQFGDAVILERRPLGPSDSRTTLTVRVTQGDVRQNVRVTQGCHGTVV